MLRASVTPDKHKLCLYKLFLFGVPEGAPTTVVFVCRISRRRRHITHPPPAIGLSVREARLGNSARPIAGEDYEDAPGRLNDLRSPQPPEPRDPSLRLHRRHRRPQLQTFTRVASRARSVRARLLFQLRSQLLPIQPVRGQLSQGVVESRDEVSLPSRSSARDVNATIQDGRHVDIREQRAGNAERRRVVNHPTGRVNSSKCALLLL